MKTIAAAALILAAASGAAHSQQYPAKPVRMVLALGGGAEVAARAIGDRLAQSMGQPFLVEAMPGAGGSQGAETVARAAPDGYTIGLITPNTHVYRPYIVQNLSYDPIKDFTPIGKITDTYSCLVAHTSFPAATFAEFIEYARRNPGKVSYATTGIGTGHHLNAEQIMQRTGISFVHVPYKGGNQQMQDLLGGQIPVASVIIGTVAPYLKSGKIRVLAVFGNRRYKTLPDVPTVPEVIPGFESLIGWMGYVGPAGLPQPIVARLHKEIGAAIGDPGFQAKLEGIGFVVDPGTPEELSSLIKRDLATAGRLAKMAGIKPE
jgi:tripartite-type tricarboxylate transporter receptor subunit TctC